MPDHPTWLDRVPHIIGTLKTETGPPFLDRTSIETLFGVRRRQAIVLLHRFKGYQVGRTFLVSRESVIEYLEQQLPEGAVQTEEVRKQHVAEFLGEARQALNLPRITLPPASTSGLSRQGLMLAGEGNNFPYGFDRNRRERIVRHRDRAGVHQRETPSILAMGAAFHSQALY